MRIRTYLDFILISGNFGRISDPNIPDRELTIDSSADLFLARTGIRAARIRGEALGSG
jgi:hypothetical protein